MSDVIEKRWYNVAERLPKANEIVWFLWRNRPDDVVIGYRLEGEGYEPNEGWYELDNKARYTNWWHPYEKPVVTQNVIDWLEKI